MDIRIEDARPDGGSLTIMVETDTPRSAAAIVAAIRAALRDAGVR